MIEIVKKFILATNGVWPDLNTYMALRISGALPHVVVVSHNSTGLMASITFSHTLGNLELTREEYKTEASKMGFINGYRWGVEYPTKGKKPDLPDDVKVKWYDDFDSREATVSPLNWDGVLKFKITDQRYKPADTSYLVSEIPESKSNTENVSDLPKTNFNEGSEHFEWIANQFENVDDINTVWKLRDKLYHNRKAEAEKKRVVDAAFASLSEFNKAHQVLGDLYDAGFLRMPEQK